MTSLAYAKERYETSVNARDVESGTGPLNRRAAKPRVVRANITELDVQRQESERLFGMLTNRHFERIVLFEVSNLFLTVDTQGRPWLRWLV